MLENISTLKPLAKDKLVLLVEDDEAIMKTLVTFLSKFFLDVHTESNVDNALATYKEMLKNKTPIVVITDINLGAKNGIELTCLVKEINSNQKVIAISACNDKNIFIESIKCGLNRFVLKPIDMDDMFRALINVLKDIEYDLELEKSKKLIESSKEYSLKLIDEQNQFLKNAVHEINTPLAVIIANIDLLRMQNMDTESLNAIEAGARIIQNSYEDMTYLMKQDRIVYKKTDIDLVEFVKSRISFFGSIAKANDLEISLRVGYPNLPRINFCDLKLQRIIDNTISNALKYSYRATTISISLGLEDEKLFFEIKNRCRPINKIDKIFERHYREDQDKGGLGLGLSIVHQICKEENIVSKVSSSVENGTSFRYVFLNKI